MKIGKLDWDELKEIIQKNKGAKREEVRIGSSIGEDCSVIDFGQEEIVLSTDPITGANNNIGKISVNINCNDIASCGVEPVGILVTILAPESSSLDEISLVMNEIHEEASKLNIEVLGGHTEVTDAVNRIIVSSTVIGKTKKGEAISTGGAKLNDGIIVTKDLCLEGSSIIASDHSQKSLNCLTMEELLEAKAYSDSLSVLKEGLIAGKFKVNSMHDITEGGVLGALWEMSRASNTGFKVYKDSMPLTEITKKLCNCFKIDALRLISSGSMLITTDRPIELKAILENEGIKATIIGSVISGKGILVDGEGTEVEVLPPKRDELFSITD